MIDTKKTNKGIYPLPTRAFRAVINTRKLNDSNVQSIKDYAFISIANSFPTQRLDNDFEFLYAHSNVLNLVFDDVYEFTKLGDRYLKPIDVDQAARSIEFINRNLSRRFLIRSSSGKSRTGAFAKIIYLMKFNTLEGFEYHYPKLHPNLAIYDHLKYFVDHPLAYSMGYD